MAFFSIDAAEYKALRQKLKDSDKPIRAAANKKLRVLAKPIGEKVRQEAATKMPSGMQSYAATNAKPIVSVAGTYLAILFRDRRHKAGDGAQVSNWDKGINRHPVFPRGSDRKKWPWHAQSITPNAYTEAFDVAAQESMEKLAEVLDDIARSL